MTLMTRAAQTKDGARAEELPVYDARALTEGGNMALIVLDGHTYVLRITRQGKLILTK